MDLYSPSFERTSPIIQINLSFVMDRRTDPPTFTLLLNVPNRLIRPTNDSFPTDEAPEHHTPFASIETGIPALHQPS
jgi:hypothetical protein